MNPVIKFTTLFGLLAVELGVQLAAQYGVGDEPRAGGACSSLGSAVFVWRSFYGMRIRRRTRLERSVRENERFSEPMRPIPENGV